MCLNTQAWYYFLPSIQRSVIFPMKVQQKVVKVPLVMPPTAPPPESQPESPPPTTLPANDSLADGDGTSRGLTETPEYLCSGSLKQQINKYSQYELCDQQPVPICGERVLAASVIEQFISNTPLFELPKPVPPPAPHNYTKPSVNKTKVVPPSKPVEPPKPPPPKAIAFGMCAYDIINYFPNHTLYLNMYR